MPLCCRRLILFRFQDFLQRLCDDCETRAAKSYAEVNELLLGIKDKVYYAGPLTATLAWGTEASPYTATLQYSKQQGWNDVVVVRRKLLVTLKLTKEENKD